MTAWIYRTQVSHLRKIPIRNAFRYRSRWWLVDVDDLPQLPALLRPFVRFEARDHLGDPAATLRQNVDAHLATEGIDLEGGQVRMLTCPRSLGHEFNPLSVFWCYHRDGTLAATLAEVHNTYGGRHVYCVRTDERGRAVVDKAFYVSPFNPVDGYYVMNLPEPGRELTLSVTLHRGQGSPFVAAVTGTGCPATTTEVLRTVATGPVESLKSSALIRWQGVRLYLRGLPVVPRKPSSTAAELQPPHPAVPLRSAS